jgi:hypothetical protein
VARACLPEVVSIEAAVLIGVESNSPSLGQTCGAAAGDGRCLTPEIAAFRLRLQQGATLQSPHIS